MQGSPAVILQQTTPQGEIDCKNLPACAPESGWAWAWACMGMGMSMCMSMGMGMGMGMGLGLLGLGMGMGKGKGMHMKTRSPCTAGGRAVAAGGRADLRPQRVATHASTGGNACTGAYRLTGGRERHATRRARVHHWAALQCVSMIMLTHTAVLSTCRPHGRPSDSGPLASRVQPKSELGSSRVDPSCLCAFIYTTARHLQYL